ncbi:MAG: radical SAM protein, partial [bacterium]
MEKKVYGVMRVLEGMKYSPVGNHSAVQVCRWARNSLNGRGVCWKEKFYGIESHRCCEFSPAVMWCENQCLHCWRPIEMNFGSCLNKEEIDDPKEIIDKIVEARKKLLMGFKGNKNVDAKKFKEALEPTLFTMSLSGEPTIYPRLAEMIKEIRKRKAVSFLVTNGQNPQAIAKLKKENALPTQLTVSMNAPNEKLFKVWHRSTK